MKTRFLSLVENLRTSLWFIPTLMALGAFALALFMPWVDNHYAPDKGPKWLSSLVFSGTPSGARSLLSSVAGSMINVAGTVFSITIVALTLASSQFGPRLLRNFMRDRTNQTVLGTFIATFLYCLLVMRRVYGGPDDIQNVPHLSISVGVLLTLTSLGVLIYFIHHIAQSIQAPHVVAEVGRELDEQIDKLFPKDIGEPDEGADGVAGQPAHGTPADRQKAEQLLADAGVAVRADAGGYIQAIGTDSLMGLARGADAVFRLCVRPGDWVMPGGPLLVCWPPDRVDGDLVDDVNGVVIRNSRRSPTQDVEFSVLQLVEVAVRALSPGINDPFTAMNCIDQLGANLVHLAGKTFPATHRYDEEGELRIIAEAANFGGIVDAAFNQIRQNGGKTACIVIRLLEVIAMVSEQVHDEGQRDSLRRHVRMIAECVPGLTFKPDREDAQRRIASALEALDEPDFENERAEAPGARGDIEKDGDRKPGPRAVAGAGSNGQT